ncbi:MAG: hypothetical protein KC933_16795 [Myxococcales bacterium]|nr:hypothetical protein [Myxococcales bacterium]
MTDTRYKGGMDAREQLSACATSAGILASPEDRHNYRRVWARDGVIAALGAVVAELPRGPGWLRTTLETLAGAQGPVGQVPSNVTCGESPAVSYGTAAVRLDASLWFMVGVGVLARLDGGASETLVQAALRARTFLRAWEGNEGGLLYVPRAGNWADEYPVLGYTLYDNALRLWAEREVDGLLTARGQAAEARDYMSPLRRALLAGPTPLSWSDPAELSSTFFGFGTALLALLAPEEDARPALDWLEAHVQAGLLPAFSPPIRPEDPAWAHLEALAGYGLRNTPGRYHNGGLWPVVSGWAAAAARLRGRDALADVLAAGISAANRDGAFPEFVDAIDGTFGGTRGMAWSAAAELLATAPRPAVAALVGAALTPPAAEA